MNYAVKKEARYSGVHTVWIHLYKTLEKKSDQWLSWARI